MGQLAPAQRRIETHRPRRVDAADHHGIALVQDGDAGGEADFGGELPQHRQRDIGQRDIAHGEIAQPRQAEPQPIAPVGPGPGIGDEAMGEQGLQDRIGGRLGKALAEGEIGEARALAAAGCDQLQQVEGAPQALHPIALRRSCDARRRRRGDVRRGGLQGLVVFKSRGSLTRFCRGA